MAWSIKAEAPPTLILWLAVLPVDLLLSPVQNRVFYVDDACGVLDHHLPVSGVAAAGRREVHSVRFLIFVRAIIASHEILSAVVPHEGVVVTHLVVLEGPGQAQFRCLVYLRVTHFIAVEASVRQFLAVVLP